MRAQMIPVGSEEWAQSFQQLLKGEGQGKNKTA